MRKSVGTAVLAGLSAGVLLLGGGSAQAATSKDIPRTVTWDSNHGGSAEFKSLGDDLVVCDNKSGDAYGAGASLIDSSGNTLEQVYDGVPDGTCISSNQNLSEGVQVYLVVCLYRDGVPDYCTESVWGAT